MREAIDLKEKFNDGESTFPRKGAGKKIWKKFTSIFTSPYAKINSKSIIDLNVIDKIIKKNLKTA